MKKGTSRPVLKKKKLLIPLVAVLAIFVFIILEVSHTTHFFSKNSSTPAASSNENTPTPINSSPATAEDNQAINSEKESSPTPTTSVTKSTPTPSTTTNSITITIVQASQDSAGKPFIVSTIIGGISSGSCQLALTKGSNTVTKQADIVAQPSYVTCKGFSIAASEFAESGTWNMKLTITNTSGQSKQTEQSVTINKG